MNNKAKNIIKNISYTLSSNLIGLIISTVVLFLVPKLVGVEQYGYWQLYLFYSSFVGFLHFGWNDGLYLRYGGKEYKDLDKGLFFSQFYMLVILQITLAIIFFVFSFLFVVDINRQFIFEMTGFCLLIVNVKYMLLLILQSTNRIKEYAQITLIGKVLFFCIIVLFLSIGIREYQLMILADLTGNLIALIYALYCCKDIVFRRISSFYFSFREALENISVGIKLMFANLASMLIIGVIRFGIERSWNISTFAKVSLTLSVSNLMMIFINAVGIVIFPILRRTDENKLSNIYITIRDFLMVILLGSLTLYYPLKVALSAWLPKYSDSLMYMSLLFPMFVYEGKMALLINTYLKTLRKEKLMLKINLLSLFFSVIITFFSTIVLRNLNLAIISIVILMAFRSTLAEILLLRTLKIYLYKDIFIELIMTLIFILAGWYLNSWIALVLYTATYVIYLVNKRRNITVMIKKVKFSLKA
ncbi:hypothetical protein MKZ21_23120 [Paenibacillus sp. FSL P2-0536]|uniref:hypothetical protein n=1 Tax=Paenibacillus sp. FSL P2-0536 TaxID=2921629 RepID=UPI0030F6630E